MVELAAEITVMKKVKETEVSDIQVRCTAWFGDDSCNSGERLNMCSLCHIKDEVNELRRLFEKRYGVKMEANYFSKMEDKLIALLRKMANALIPSANHLCSQHQYLENATVQMSC